MSRALTFTIEMDRLRRQIELQYKIPPFLSFCVLRELDALIWDESYQGLMMNQIDPHKVNSLEGPGRPCCCIIPRGWADGCFGTEFWLVSCELPWDWKQLELMARAGKGMIIECRGPVEEKKARYGRDKGKVLNAEEVFTYNGALPPNWKRIYCADWGSNSLLRKPWDRDNEVYDNDAINSNVQKCMDEIWRKLNEWNPSICFINCKQAINRCPVVASALQVGATGEFKDDDTRHIGKMMVRHMLKVRPGVDMIASIEEHIKVKDPVERHKHHRGYKFLEKAFPQLRASAKAAGRFEEDGCLPPLVGEDEFRRLALDALEIIPDQNIERAAAGKGDARHKAARKEVKIDRNADDGPRGRHEDAGGKQKLVPETEQKRRGREHRDQAQKNAEEQLQKKRELLKTRGAAPGAAPRKSTPNAATAARGSGRGGASASTDDGGATAPGGDGGATAPRGGGGATAPRGGGGRKQGAQTKSEEDPEHEEAAEEKSEDEDPAEEKSEDSERLSKDGEGSDAGAGEREDPHFRRRLWEKLLATSDDPHLSSRGETEAICRLRSAGAKT